ncbi:MAG TPA: hypothetical protein VK277_09670 [Acidimicrobiales bacterium]|nr:hypothetical protein [Acidimicrobiales bacterium]
MVTTTIPGASVWEQELYDNLSHHVGAERDILEQYRELAEEASSPAFRYLAKLILDDEERHHRLFADLAATVKSFAELRSTGQPIPYLDEPGTDRDRLREETEHFLEVERKDLGELRKLSKQLRSVQDTTLWGLIVELMQMDTNKHIRILEFIRENLGR